MKQFITLLAVLFSVNVYAQNVGIGEINPIESKLQVKTADSAALLIQNTATALNTKTALFYKSDNNYSGSIATIQTAPSFYRMGLFTFGGAVSGLKERLSILDGGNVGIGTITPTAKLDIAGTIKIADGTQGLDKVLTSDAAGNASWQSIPTQIGVKKKISIPCSAFQPEFSTIGLQQSIINGNWVYYDNGTASTVKMFAPLMLPDGVKVTQMSIYYFDNSTINLSVSIDKVLYSPPSVSYGGISGSTLTTSGVNGGLVSSQVLTTGPLTEVVNNSGRSYFVRIAANGIWSGIDLRVGMIEIEYEIL
jgi:hypothetical protein